MSEPAWKKQLEIAIQNTIKNEIITASGDGVSKPSQYVEGCVKSIMEQVDFSESQISRELQRLTDLLGYEEKNLEEYIKLEDFIRNYCVNIEHKYF